MNKTLPRLYSPKLCQIWGFLLQGFDRNVEKKLKHTSNSFSLSLGDKFRPEILTFHPSFKKWCSISDLRAQAVPNQKISLFHEEMKDLFPHLSSSIEISIIFSTSTTLNIVEWKYEINSSCVVKEIRESPVMNHIKKLCDSRESWFVLNKSLNTPLPNNGEWWARRLKTAKREFTI